MLSTENEEDRLAALHSYHIFDTAEEKDFDALTALASAICQVPIALITFIDEKRQHFKSHHGTDLTENLREFSFCTHAINAPEEMMIVPDATLDERFKHNPIVTGPTRIMFYAGVPLVNEDGHALGTLCLVDQHKHTLSAEQVSALKTLAAQVMDKLELRRQVIRLKKNNQELLNANVLIQKFASMAAHDIKNPLSSMLLTAQALRIRHEKMEDEVCLRLVDLNITSTKNLLNLVNEMMAYSKSPSILLARKMKFNLQDTIAKILSMIHIPENIIIDLPQEQHELYMSMIAFEQIMLNLFSNAIRYNNKDHGHIILRFKEDEELYFFEVEDNGIGIAEAYHEKIFGNNFTLKLTDRYNEKGNGIGLSTVKDLVTALDGSIYVQSVPGDGATFFLTIRK